MRLPRLWLTKKRRKSGIAEDKTAIKKLTTVHFDKAEKKKEIHLNYEN